MYSFMIFRPPWGNRSFSKETRMNLSGSSLCRTRLLGNWRMLRVIASGANLINLPKILLSSLLLLGGVRCAWGTVKRHVS
ncbi:hypothetical protein M404DRAFT_281017 [Pisolithus tinctorius Marx 270]|uniref:Uncharacterized protein n=1 Tax=Pisolithus tinctorius Marx 270 TaxID=870435 RepID=A0A0C3PLQ1_PISTI|nr:hypothetical protein M404DRAFT_281017 [Pisolithus tinctorius Marx 270]